MIMKRLIVLSLLAVGALSACTTRMTVKKATDATPGLRYYLPRPVLVAKPQSDGSVTFSIEYLSDTTQEYAIDAKSYVAKHKLRVETEASGILKKVQWNPTATEVPSQVATSAGEVVKAELARRDADAAKTKAAADAQQKKVDDAQAEIQKIRDDIALLDAKIAEVEKLGKDASDAKVERAVDVVKLQNAIDHLADITKAAGASGAGNDVTKQDAQTKLANANNAVTAATTALADADKELAAATATNKEAAAKKRAKAVADLRSLRHAADAARFSQAWGPVLYVIKEGTNEAGEPTVFFAAANEQQQIGTSKKPEAKPAPVEIELRLKGSGVVRPVKNNKKDALQLIVVPRPAIHDIDASKVQVVNTSTKALVKDAVVIANLNDENVIVVDLKPTLPAGAYTVTIPYRTSAKSEKTSQDVPFVVIR